MQDGITREDLAVGDIVTLSKEGRRTLVSCHNFDLQPDVRYFGIITDIYNFITNPTSALVTARFDLPLGVYPYSSCKDAHVYVANLPEIDFSYRPACMVEAYGPGPVRNDFFPELVEEVVEELEELEVVEDTPVVGDHVKYTTYPDLFRDEETVEGTVVEISEARGMPVYYLIPDEGETTPEGFIGRRSPDGELTVYGAEFHGSIEFSCPPEGVATEDQIEVGITIHDAIDTLTKAGFKVVYPVN